MNRHYFFRKGDFFKWYKAYTECKVYLKTYRYNYTNQRRNLEYVKYKEAHGIVEEYKIFICSLSENDKLILVESIKMGRFDERELYLHPEIIENWESIVLNANKHLLADIDLTELGKQLKEYRELQGYYRAEAARYLGIAERTLKSYEDGEREISINTFFKIVQLYEVGDVSNLFYKKNSRKVIKVL